MSTVHLHRWTDIGAVEDFSEEEPVAVEAGGMQLAIFRLEDQLFALHDLCTHGVARLSEGYVEDGCVECPLHQGLFDIRTGAAKCAPVTEAVRSFPLRIHEGRVQVAVEAEAATAKPAAVEVVLTSLDKVAPDVALVRMQLPAAHRFAYQPGQYIDILLGDQRRSYSLAQVTANALELHIRHLPGGLFTDQLFHQLAPGTPLTIDGPHGQFTLQATQKPKIMVATGTGFAPVKAMLEALIAAGSGVPVTLYWGGRTLRTCTSIANAWIWPPATPGFITCRYYRQPPRRPGWGGKAMSRMRYCKTGQTYSHLRSMPAARQPWWPLPTSALSHKAWRPWHFLPMLSIRRPTVDRPHNPRVSR